jgi:hypothetical protein
MGVNDEQLDVFLWKNRQLSPTELRSADGSLWYRITRPCDGRRRPHREEWGEGNSGVKELQEAEEHGRTLLGCALERFSWCLSRRLRKRATPDVFIMAMGPCSADGGRGTRDQWRYDDGRGGIVPSFVGKRE